MSGDLAVIDAVFEGPNEDDVEIKKLKLRIRTLEREVEDERLAAQRARDDATRAVGMLRRQLSPLYRALQAVFGELDLVAAAEPESAASSPSPAAPRTSAVWEAWKSRLPPACGKVIDALLTHGELNSVQIKVAARLGTSTVSDAISKLNKAGLIDKNGGRYSLKKL